jgi:hypothetical protein
MASQMQCPLHQRAAIVDVVGDDLETPQTEVFTCCEVSRQRVREAVEEILASSAQPVHGDPVYSIPGSVLYLQNPIVSNCHSLREQPTQRCITAHRCRRRG